MAKPGVVEKTAKIQKQMAKQYKPRPVKPMKKSGRGR